MYKLINIFADSTSRDFKRKKKSNKLSIVILNVETFSRL